MFPEAVRGRHWDGKWGQLSSCWMCHDFVQKPRVRYRKKFLILKLGSLVNKRVIKWPALKNKKGEGNQKKDVKSYILIQPKPTSPWKSYSVKMWILHEEAKQICPKWKLIEHTPFSSWNSTFKENMMIPLIFKKNTIRNHKKSRIYMRTQNSQMKTIFYLNSVIERKSETTSVELYTLEVEINELKSNDWQLTSCEKG